MVLDGDKIHFLLVVIIVLDIHLSIGKDFCLVDINSFIRIEFVKGQKYKNRINKSEPFPHLSENIVLHLFHI